MLGWDVPESRLEMAIGKSYKCVDAERKRIGHVVGVVGDFYCPLREKIGPVAMILRSKQFYNLAIRIRTQNLQGVMAHLEDTWKQFTPKGRPFQHYFWDQGAAVCPGFGTEKTPPACATGDFIWLRRCYYFSSSIRFVSRPLLSRQVEVARC